MVSTATPEAWMLARTSAIQAGTVQSSSITPTRSRGLFDVIAGYRGVFGMVLMVIAASQAARIAMPDVAPCRNSRYDPGVPRRARSSSSREFPTKNAIRTAAAHSPPSRVLIRVIPQKIFDCAGKLFHIINSHYKTSSGRFEQY